MDEITSEVVQGAERGSFFSKLGFANRHNGTHNCRVGEAHRFIASRAIHL